MVKRGTPGDRNAIVPLPVTVPTDNTSVEAQTDVPGPSGLASTRWSATLDRVLSVQRPVVVAHVDRIRRRRPDATPAEVIAILERQYLTAVSTGGAAVGASAVIPGVGFATSLGLTGAETAAFLEASALFAQSVTEVHGIAVTDPERARTLVMAMILGAPGTSLVKQLAAQAGGGPTRTAFWGELVTSSLPRSVVSGIGGRLRDSFVKRFLARQGASVLGRAVPFGIGAVIGGVGNHALGRKVIDGSRTAFGPPPAHFPLPVSPRPERARRGRDVAPGLEAGTARRRQRALPWRRPADTDDLWADPDTGTDTPAS
ncbi:hypothetical protein [Curtobacterium sp. MCBD17_013]|uniref:hypothetical protein n=1 Tax=Curtobacterium sp. MCBD17_013 TaxID=2175668 RepID=UPI0015E894B2|nr:hypothetical protein [Curtobacterium sp. MCBD17_013]